MKHFPKPADLRVRLRVFSFLPILLFPACSSQTPAPAPATPLPPIKPVKKPHPSSSMSANDGYLGLTKAEALAKAKALGLRARVVEEDGQQFPVTKDFRPSRLNFAITKGKITRVSKG